MTSRVAEFFDELIHCYITGISQSLFFFRMQLPNPRLGNGRYKQLPTCPAESVFSGSTLYFEDTEALKWQSHSLTLFVGEFHRVSSRKRYSCLISEATTRWNTPSRGDTGRTVVNFSKLSYGILEDRQRWSGLLSYVEYHFYRALALSLRGVGRGSTGLWPPLGAEGAICDCSAPSNRECVYSEI